MLETLVIMVLFREKTMKLQEKIIKELIREALKSKEDRISIALQELELEGGFSDSDMERIKEVFNNT